MAFPDLLGFIHRLLIVAGIVLATLLLLLVLWLTVEELVLIFVGVLLAEFLVGLSDWFERKTGLPRPWSLVAVSAGIVAALGAGAWLLIPRVTDEVTLLADRFPRLVQRLQEKLPQNELVDGLFEQLSDPEKILGSAQGLIGGAAGVFTTAMGALFGLVFILFIGLYLAANPRVYTAGFLRLMPPDRRERTSEIMHEAGSTLQWWLIGRLLDMGIVAAMTVVGLWLLGVQLALFLGLMAGVLTFVPFLGPVAAAVPAVLVAAMESLLLGLYVIVLYLGIQVVESYFITPAIQQRTVSIPPVLLISAQMFMGILLGIQGVVIATPFAALLLVLTKMIYLSDILKDDSETNQ